jgi:hypothetical protein
VKRLTNKGSDYTVGYGRPPASGQFQPGQSGNAKGRPKGAHNTSEEIGRLLDSKVAVRQGGKTSRMTRRLVLVQKLYERAIGGDNRAAALLMNHDLSARLSNAAGNGVGLSGMSPEQMDEVLKTFFADWNAEGLK